MQEWLTEKRGSNVEPPRPATRRQACAHARPSNATPPQSLALHKTQRASDLTTRSKRCSQEIQDALGLDEAPLRIECYDVSNLQGTDVVASMVVFEDGLPRKSDYRRFIIKIRRDGRGATTSARSTR